MWLKIQNQNKKYKIQKSGSKEKQRKIKRSKNIKGEDYYFKKKQPKYLIKYEPCTSTPSSNNACHIPAACTRV